MAQGCGPVAVSAPQRAVQVSPGPGVTVGMPQQQAPVAWQHVSVVVFHQAAHAHKQDLALQVGLRLLGGEWGRVRGAGQPALPARQGGRQ